MLVMGVPGAGKTTVCKELSRLGYEAYDSDKGLARWEDKLGNPVQEKTEEPGWEKDHDWNIDIAGIVKIKDASVNEIIFICGSAGNIRDTIYIFDQIILLDLDEDTLKYRLENREKGYGKHPHQLKDIMSWRKSSPDEWSGYGASIVDSRKDLGEVVEDILGICKAL